MIERIGLALIALVMAAAFGGVAVAAWVGGEVFLAAMGAIGCLMTVWVGGMTVPARLINARSRPRGHESNDSAPDDAFMDEGSARPGRPEPKRRSRRTMP
jgi:hypothetical protein